MTSVKIELYTHKTLKNGEHPIVIRFIKDRKRKMISTGKSCSPELWDFSCNAPARKHPYRKELEAFLDAKKSEVSKLILKLEDSPKGYSLDQLAEKVKKKNKHKTVIAYFNEVIDRLEKTNKIGTANSFKDVRNSVFRFTKTKDISFIDIDYTFLKRYEESFLERGVMESTISVYMRGLRSIFNRAIAEGFASEDIYPFKQYKISKLKVKSKKRALSKEDMMKIINLSVEPGTPIYHAKHMFLFSFYNMGMNFKDISYLKWNDISNNRIYYQRKKTGKHYNIGILKPVQEILNEYQEYYKNDSNYVFPILSSQHKTKISQENRIKKKLKETNRQLKLIAGEIGIEANITFYVARHSWATIMKKNGTPVAVISEGMRHDSERTTQGYLDDFENSVLDDANKNLI